MTTRDLKNQLAVTQSLAPAARTASSTGAVADLQGYDSAMVLVAFGAYTDGTHTPSLQHSDDGTSFTACNASDLSGSFTAVSSSAGQNAVQLVGYVGGQRYLRPLLTIAGSTSGAVSAVELVRGHAHRQPL
jgi:hypothetical protein